MSEVKTCCMCDSNIQDTLNLGEMKVLGDLSVHYYCLLLASTVAQKGEDHEGILGFLYEDIVDEISRCKYRLCCYCQKRGASVFCSGRNCKAVFHLPCGVSRGSGHQFQGAFLSTCHNHRYRQKYVIPTTVMSCPICYDIINFKNWSQVLWAPCCKKNAYFHKECLQKMALSAGYFFKCPVCNDKSKFQKTMKTYGVFIPDRDASWEMEPNAFQELYHRHSECNAMDCICPNGRQYSSSGQWGLILCNACGSQGSHIGCLTQANKHWWTCPVCNIKPEETDSGDDPSQTEVSSSAPLLLSSDSTLASEPCCSRTLSSAVSNQLSVETNGIDAGIVKLENNTEIINIIDSDDDDVVVVEDGEPHVKCLLAQDGSLIPVIIIEKTDKIEKTDQITVQGDIRVYPEPPIKKRLYDEENIQSNSNALGIKISNVRSLSLESPPRKATKKERGPSIESGEDYVVVTNGENKTTIKYQSSTAKDGDSIKQSLITAVSKMNGVASPYQSASTPNQRTEQNQQIGNGYESSSESDVMIID